MLTYTNNLKPLVLPEYGRNIQNMVDRCLEIEDRDERTRAANSIIATMLTLFPPTGDRQEYTRKLWDHVLMMSNFRLDVDLPFEPVDLAVFENYPDPMQRPECLPMKYRHYGGYIAHMIDIASDMQEGEERDALVMLIANHMKKIMLESDNEGGIDDARIFSDLRNMSHGRIYLDPEQVRLHEFRQAPTPSGKRKKKK